MSNNNLKESYEDAIHKMNSIMKRKSDGTFEIDLKEGNFDIPPGILHDLMRSMEETNKKIKSGEINAEDLQEPVI